MRRKSKTILYCILNWGLGHATRSIPIIQGLLQKGHSVIVVSSGRSLALLRKEFPGVHCIDLPDYNVRYHRSGFALLPYMLWQLPRIFCRIVREHEETERLVDQWGVDVVISDNRYGCFSEKIPSFFITHQLRFQLPKAFQWSAVASEIFNAYWAQKYRMILVPDVKGVPNLSGALSHSGWISRHPKVRYIGLLSSLDFAENSFDTSIDYLVLISGPEPQRTVFEEIVLRQIVDLSGEKRVVLGKPEEGEAKTPWIFPHVSRAKLALWMKSAEWIIARSGYSTLMELMALGKKAILVPTPGQPEQMYLAKHVKHSGFFYAVAQHQLHLKHHLKEAKAFYRKPRPTLAYNQIDEILEILGLG